MRIKKILSLAVVLAMVMTVVPMFGLTASAASEKTYIIEFDVYNVDSLAGDHRDVGITDGDGYVITGFCHGSDGFWATDGERSFNGENNQPVLFRDGNKQVKMTIDKNSKEPTKTQWNYITDGPGNAHVKVEITSGVQVQDGDASKDGYKVVYSIGSDYQVTAEYTGIVNGIAPLSQWKMGTRWVDNSTINAETISRFIRNVSVTVGGVKTETKTNVYTPVGDTYTQEGSYSGTGPDSNFSSEKKLYVAAPTWANHRRSYLRFSVGEIPETDTITRAGLNLVTTTDTNNSMKLQVSSFDANFDETTLTWNNTPAEPAPEKITDITSPAKAEVGFNIDVTENVKSNYLANKADFGYMLWFDGQASATINLFMHSKEAEKEADKPALVIETVAEKDITDVTINFKANGAEIATPKKDKAINGFSYHYNNAPEIIANEDYTKYYKLSGTATLADVSSNNNILDIEYTEIDFADVKDAPKAADIITVNNKNYSVVNGTNLIPNPSFETASGDFDITGWYSAEPATANTQMYGNPQTVNHGFAIDANNYYSAGVSKSNVSEPWAGGPKDGNWAFGSRWDDSWKGLCSILNAFKVEPGKKYYLSYQIMPCPYDNNNDHNRGRINVGVGTGANASAPSSDKDDRLIKECNYTNNEWNKYERVFTVSEDNENPYIIFNAYDLGRNGSGLGGENDKYSVDPKVRRANGDKPTYIFDSFVLMEVEEDTKDITVKYQADETTVKTVENVKVNANDKTFTPTVNTLVCGDGVVYYVKDGKAVEIDGESNTAIVPIEKLGNVFSVQNGMLYTNNITDNGDYTGLNDFGALNWHPDGTIDRVGVAILDASTEANDYVLSGKQVRLHTQYAEGETCGIRFYAVKPSELLKGNFTVDSIKDFAVEANEVAETTFEKNNTNDRNEVYKAYVLDTAKLRAAIEDGKVAILGVSYGTLYGFKGDSLEIATTPADPVVSLGWDESKKDFTINVKTAADGIVVNDTFVAREEGKDGVAIWTAATNKPFEIYAANGNGSVKSAKGVTTSIYKMLSDEFKDGKYAEATEATVNDEKAAKASAVITMGGIIDELTEEHTQFISKQENTYTIIPDVYKLGIGFVADGGDIYIGAAPDKATISKDGDGPYDTMTVDFESKTVTLSKAVGAALETVTLSLDSVNIEFVETLVEELEANGADAEMGLVPEL